MAEILGYLRGCSGCYSCGGQYFGEMSWTLEKRLCRLGKQLKVTGRESLGSWVKVDVDIQCQLCNLFSHVYMLFFHAVNIGGKNKL